MRVELESRWGLMLQWDTLLLLDLACVHSE